MTLREKLAYCYCTDNWYKTFFRRILYTDGVKTIAEEAEAYWLIDAIESYQNAELDKKSGGFQLWTLKSNGSGGFVLTCQADSGQPNLVEQIGEFTDFPFDQFDDGVAKFYVEGEGNPPSSGQVAGRVLMLPSER